MNISSRAANQLRRVDPEIVGRILNDLPNRSYGPGSHLAEIDVRGHRFRCFIARAKDDSLVLLGVVEPRGP